MIWIHPLRLESRELNLTVNADIPGPGEIIRLSTFEYNENKMCEFYYDFVNDEPFYFCAYEYCEYADEIESGFTTIQVVVGRTESDGWSDVVTLKCDPNIKIGVVMSWLKVTGNAEFPLHYRGRILSPGKTLTNYGVGNHEYLYVRSTWPHHAGIRLADRIISDEDPRSWPRFVNWTVKDFTDKYQLQGDFTTSLQEEIISRLRSTKSNLLSGEDVWLYDLLENFFQVVYWLSKCKNKRDFAAIAHLGYKLFTGKSVTHQCKNFLFSRDSILQANFEDTVRELRNVFDISHAIDNSPLAQKLRDLYSYLLVQGFLSRFGFEISEAEFKILSKHSGQRYDQQTSLLMCVIDTSLYICEKFVDYRKTKDPTSFIHSSTTYSSWMEDADKILALAPFTSNLGAHGTTYFSFISDLDAAIEKGQAIRNHSKLNSGVESVAMQRKLQSLLLLKNMEVTRRASQKERECPFGVLVHGSSSVGKSTFTKMLYYYFGSIHGLRKDDHFRYVRNPADEYWSNFDSSKWCIQMDDIAFLLPSKTNEVDPTLKEMLNVVNNVPYVPPQAALEDKGKTPVLAKLVVATSNAKDLNAHEYFYCPLAVRRRLPFVVNIKPKDKYLHANKKFINPEALPAIGNEYPDFWVITVQKVVPVESGGRDRARLQDVAVYENVMEFLAHFGQASFDHLETQQKSHTWDQGMRDIDVCPLCFCTKDNCECLQADEGQRSGIISCIYECICMWFVYSLSISYILAYFRMIARVRIMRTVSCWMANFGTTALQVKMQGIMNQARVSKEFKYSIVALSAFGVMVYVCTRNARKPANVSQREPEPTAESYPLELQGNKFSTTEADLEKEDTANVWYTSTMELASFDVPRPSLSSTAKDGPSIRDLVAHNCVRLHITALDENYSCRTGAVFVRGQFLVLNGHVLRKGSAYKIEIQDMTQQGVSSNHRIEVQKRDFSFLEKRDLACIQVMSMPPFKDITKYWNESPIPITQIVSVKRTNQGDVGYQYVYGVNFVESFPIEALEIRVPMYMGRGQVDTQPGDCGSLGVGLTPRGPVIVGIHTVGYTNMCGFPHVLKSELMDLLSSATLISHADGGGQPKLSLNGDVQLVPPHHKSIVRYMEEGTARVYGSFAGFRPKPRSRVIRTPICKDVLEHFQTTVKHGQPAMNGWEPWRKNVIEMVRPTVNYDRRLFVRAKKMFLEEILATLPLQWEKDLVILSDRAAVNGLPGVKYIDRINCNSSMGHPWNTTKKKYLIPDICPIYPEGVNFEKEIWDSVREIEHIYEEGGRAFPIYTGHLKDEPTLLRKCEAKKTRVFTGSSLPYSLVVRKYLLSFVRLVQKNKFVFEAGPGTVVQSMEWTEFHNYLTHFGEERMIAGDYGKFDKRMIADFILAAFDIIVEIHERAGFAEEELLYIRGIAADTSFPLVNMNGDLIEFYGTNPSGHPLTVIINSLVNCLYMRYAYLKLGEQHFGQVPPFKKYVRLMTYGDDNVMGVSSEIPWFNHTAIQDTLGSIGVEYTMADKEAESVPFVHINTVTFLKRSWVFDGDVGAYLAPLEEESIHKSLTTWIPSGTIDPNAQVVAVLQSANSEYFFYGREVFEKHHKFFKELLAREPYCHYVTDTTLPGWDELVNRFWKASESQS